MKKFGEILKSYFPIIGLVLVVVIFAILTEGKLLAMGTLKSMLSTVMLTALVSIGSVFVFGSGCFDMSMGGTLCMSAVVGCYAGIATGSVVVVFLGCLGTSLVLNVLKAIFAAYVEVPLFIVTIVLGSILSALVLVMMGTETTIFFKGKTIDTTFHCCDYRYFQQIFRHGNLVCDGVVTFHLKIC
jgi:ribose transport system permease protein